MSNDALLKIFSPYSLHLQIWQTTRVQRLESDLACLKREVESLRKRLGINYLEDMNEFQKEVSRVKLSIIIYLTILLATFLFAVASLRVDGNTLKESLYIYYLMLWCVIYGVYMGDTCIYRNMRSNENSFSILFWMSCCRCCCCWGCDKQMPARLAFLCRHFPHN